MSGDETKAAAALLLGWLREAKQPLDPSDIQRLRTRENAAVSADALSYAAWDLVDKGQAEFTRDRKIVAR